MQGTKYEKYEILKSFSTNNQGFIFGRVNTASLDLRSSNRRYPSYNFSLEEWD